MEVEQKTSEDQKKKSPKWAIEPALFLLFFGWFLSVSIVENQILRQTCLYVYRYDKDVCNNLDDKNKTLSIEQEIQPYALNILMTISISSAVTPTILSLFLGPWSDKYGRKKIFNGIFIGCTTSMGWITAVSYLSDYVEANSPWNYFFAQLPLKLSGGLPTFTTVFLCYITDITDEDSRSRRFTLFELILFASVLFAFASSSFILQLTNPTIVFAISFLCMLIGTVIELIFVEETVNVKRGVAVTTQLKDIFTLDRIKELYSTCVQRRQFRQRKILFCLGSVLWLTSFVNNGGQTVFYYFVRQYFGWNLQDLTLYMSASMLITVFGSIFALVVLKQCLCISDLSLSALSTVSVLLDAFIKTFANRSWQMYVASAVALFKLVAGPMLRTIMSTIVPPGEISKVYGLTIAFEAIAGLIAAFAYKIVYTATLTTFPSAFNLISVGIFTVTLVLIGLIAKWLQVPNVSRKTCDTKL